MIGTRRQLPRRGWKAIVKWQDPFAAATYTTTLRIIMRDRNRVSQRALHACITSGVFTTSGVERSLTDGPSLPELVVVVIVVILVPARNLTSAEKHRFY